MMVPSITKNNNVASNDDADIYLSGLTENSLMISNSQEVTKFHHHVLTCANKGRLYSNGLSKMTTTIGEENEVHESSESSDDTLVTATKGPLGESSTETEVGLLGATFPDSWCDWESKRRRESVGHHKNNMKKHHQRQLRRLKKIQDKTGSVKRVKVPSAVSCRRRRLRLERSIGRHLRNGCQRSPSTLPPPPLTKDSHESEVVPFQFSKSLRRRQRRRVVRFRDEEIAEATLEWKQEQRNPVSFGRGLGTGVNKEEPFREAHQERKRNQRALLDLQVGMKHMGL